MLDDPLVEFARDDRLLDQKIRSVCTTREEYFQVRGVMFILKNNSWKNSGQYNYDEGIGVFRKYFGRSLQFDPLPQYITSSMPPRERTAYQIVKDWAMVPIIFSYNCGKLLRWIITPEERDLSTNNSIDKVLNDLAPPNSIPEKSYVKMYNFSGSIDRLGGILAGVGGMPPAFIIGLLAVKPNEYKEK